MRLADGLSLRLAWRNIWRQKRRTWLTATAMIFSNILLIFMISIQLGSYEMMINNSLQLFSGQLQIQHAGYHEDEQIRQQVDDIAILAADLRKHFAEAHFTARASAFVLVSGEQRSFGIQLVGIEPAHEKDISTLPGLLKSGRYLREGDGPSIVIGRIMARNLQLEVGDALTFLGSGKDGSFAAGVVRVAGIFESGIKDLDRGLAEVPLKYFQETFSMHGGGHVIAVSVPDLDAVATTRASLQAAVAERPGLVVLDWDALMPGLRQAIQADMTSAWFMYGVLIVLVAFSVLNTQLMSVLERTREFGVIMALGIKPRRLASLVLLETALMALLGLLIGLLLGTAVTGYVAHTGFSYPGMQEMADKFNLSAVMFPRVSVLSVMFGPLVVFLFCLLAAIYPALKLYRLQPVAAMRAA